VTREAYLPEYRLPQDPMLMLRTKSVVKQGSICDLPERTWDAATMFFCAESITEHQDEFEAACAAFARCVKPVERWLPPSSCVRRAIAWRNRPFPVLFFPQIDRDRVCAACKWHTHRKDRYRRTEDSQRLFGFVSLTGAAR
jgi:hypothetical protein